MDRQETLNCIYQIGRATYQMFRTPFDEFEETIQSTYLMGFIGRFIRGTGIESTAAVDEFQNGYETEREKRTL